MRQGRAGPPSWAPGLSSSSLPGAWWAVPAPSVLMTLAPCASITSRQLAAPLIAARWNLEVRGEGLAAGWPPLSHPTPPGHGHSRGLALGVQLRGHQALADDEGGHPCGIIVLHSLQQPLVTFAPVLALWARPEDHGAGQPPPSPPSPGRGSGLSPPAPGHLPGA